uniref:Uncharacterized protein n=1 Tax=Candidatus Kentrum eta TaxID=2126337 RepID=A0A450UHN6_9GAMM|nr:MAG: hypothetical protein BECKH772A_GA0070896_1003814 [Candidatus Kentron sp. H]VFJ93090.1 MAG: hypothetical protein BECKH772B_GA0070898_1003814 [Candidatus Kentron sp. H]VFJ99939.1 MAG: hypothetical protein BECKH772C_GA0070978_1003714 [Candidatus Kentron sp. H]
MKAVRFLLPAELEMIEAASDYQARVDGLGDMFPTEIESAVRDIAEDPRA